jgi:PPK2 family polyphosphate:nucleotide phosphotransferase
MYKDKSLLVPPGKKISLKDYDPDYTDSFEDKDSSKEQLEKDIKEMFELQDVFYADNSYSILIVLQAMDTAGKDGLIKHVMRGLNPEGCVVHSFKQPSSEELEHNFLWRHWKVVPKRGEITIFNRSHYEDVLVTRVHPELILKQNLPGVDSVDKINNDFWQERYKQIRNFERTLHQNGTIVVKFYLNLSKKEQKKRFLARIDDPNKNWKFSPSDATERQFWSDYMKAYEDAISNTSTEYAPWYIIPADNKWYTRLAVANILKHIMKNLKISYPKLNSDELKRLQDAKAQLESEK